MNKLHKINLFNNLFSRITIVLFAVIVSIMGLYTFTAKTVFAQKSNMTMPGDVDDDNKVTLTDAKIILKHSLGIETITDENKIKNADINEDNVVNLIDAKMALKASLGIIFITEKPIVTNEPIKTITPPAAEVTPPATTIPNVTQDAVATAPATETPLPEKTRKLEIVEALEENVVTGEAVVVSGLNGAIYDETSNVYTFTKQTIGIDMKNPFAGRTDLCEKVVDVISKTAEEGKSLVWDLKGASIDGDNQLEINEIDKMTYYYIDKDVTYTTPKWTKGVSISFWAKVSKEERKKPLLVFENPNFAISMWADGSVYFRDGNMRTNMLDNTSDNILGEFGEWNHYTLTIANDWITVYVNGQENLFDTVWLSRKIIGGFNDGFLSRYNFPLDLNQEMVDNDERGYYMISGAWNGIVYHDNFSTFANHRFRGCNSKGTLMLDYITNENTNLWLGGTKVLVGEKYATYSFEESVQISDVKAYDKELTPQEVSANYKFEALSTKPADK